MIKYFDNKPEPQLDEPKRTSYGEKVFTVVKDMNEVKFRKKKKDTEGTTRNRKRDNKEEPYVIVPFKKKSIFFKYLL
jgi:hypothetical protein